MLENKRVVITDSNEFMGPAMSARFVRDGAQVIADELSLIHISEPTRPY